MNICETNKHEEIVYEGRKCPLCDAVAKIESLESEIQGMAEAQ